MSKELEQIFKKSSKTYFTASLFFPPAVRKDVIRLYAFVRIADDFVDTVPSDPVGFLDFANRYRKGMLSGPTNDLIIDAFVDLAKRYCFDPAWAETFLQSMEWDLYKGRYRTMEELIEYMDGSAEVIGLFMARILGLPAKADSFARMQGRAMQLINFIRDINEDNLLGREYLPAENRREGLLCENTAKMFAGEFQRYIRNLLQTYRIWQREAEAGYKYIPRRYLIPIKTAADMYLWTAQVIEKDPFVVYKRKIKPSKSIIIGKGLLNSITAIRGGDKNAEQDAGGTY
jgi:15-cis-phytoene synthase